MTAPTHIGIGIIIWLATRNPYIAIPLAYFSHAILDLFCLYHPDKLLLLNSKGKWLLFIIDLIALGGLIYLIRDNWSAWFYGIVIAWLGYDLQWILRWMGLEIYKIHDLFGRRFDFEHTWRLILIEVLVMVYSLIMIWKIL